MNGIIKTFSIIFLLLLFSSCKSPAYIEKADNISLSSYKTYKWVNTSASENEESKRAMSYADINVHNAVNEELMKRWGWKEVLESPDVLITYDMLVEKTSSTQRDPVYTNPMVRYYYNYSRKKWYPIYFPSRFVGYDVYEEPVKEGTLTITIIDANTDKKIWQGWTTEKLNNSRITNKEIKNNVVNIFNNGK